MPFIGSNDNLPTQLISRPVAKCGALVSLVPTLLAGVRVTLVVGAENDILGACVRGALAPLVVAHPTHEVHRFGVALHEPGVVATNRP